MPDPVPVYFEVKEDLKRMTGALNAASYAMSFLMYPGSENEDPKVLQDKILSNLQLVREKIPVVIDSFSNNIDELQSPKGA